MLKRVTGDGYMPPWHPVEGHGEFLNERRLTKEETALVAAWGEDAYERVVERLVAPGRIRCVADDPVGRIDVAGRPDAHSDH